MVHDGLPTEDELARIEAATRYRLGMPLTLSGASSAFGLAVTLGTPELLAIIERAANDRKAAAVLNVHNELVVNVQESARKALQPGFVPYVIRWRHRHR